MYSHDKNSSIARADNTMGVYYSKEKNLFVVAVAGTNAISSFGWMKEDFDVNNKVEWQSITGHGKGSISRGTATGLDILTKEMKDKGNDFFTAITTYMNDQDIDTSEIAVTGHSLGGALSTALALYVSNKKEELNSTKSIKVSAYPVASPTIGEHTFIEYYQDQIKEGNIEYNAFKNSLDIVPMAWDKKDLASIPNFYINEDEKYNIEDDSLGTAALVAVLNTVNSTNNSQVIYKHIEPITTLSGSFNDCVDGKINKAFKTIKDWKFLLIPDSLQKNIANLQSIARFFTQAAYQHTHAYNKLLDIEPFMEMYTIIRKGGLETYTALHTIETLMDTQEATYHIASEAAGFDIGSLLQLSELNEEELKKLEEHSEE